MESDKFGFIVLGGQCDCTSCNFMEAVVSIRQVSDMRKVGRCTQRQYWNDSEYS